jgi:hypothetical protein
MSTPAEELRRRARGRAKLDLDRASVENTMVDLVAGVTRLDQAIKHVAPAREIALANTNCILQASLVLEKLALQQVTVWNEL